MERTDGRPVAVGVKVANPDLDVLVVGGDGDAFSIGGDTFRMPSAGTSM